MKRLLAATLGSVLLLTAGGAIATPPGPGKHFDCSDAGGAMSCASDDTGCVPGSKDDPSAPNVAATLKCADAIAKAFSKAVKAVITCHKKQADAAFKAAPVDDEACEKGPNVVCVEDQVWYCGVQPDDVDDIVKAVNDGTVVDRLTENTDRVTRNLIFTVLEAGLLPGDI